MHKSLSMYVCMYVCMYASMYVYVTIWVYFIETGGWKRGKGENMYYYPYSSLKQQYDKKYIDINFIIISRSIIYSIDIDM